MINQNAYKNSNLDYIELQLKYIHLLSETMSSWLNHFVIMIVCMCMWFFVNRNYKALPITQVFNFDFSMHK
jgi:hypothetical protein